MDWEGVLSADLAQIEENVSVAEALYSFLLSHEIAEAPELAGEAGKMARVATVVRAVMKVKGEEAQAAFEELRIREEEIRRAGGGGGGTERDLLDQIVQLEKEVRHRDTVISEFRERGAATSGNEARYLREEIEDLKQEMTDVRRSLDHERLENERLTADASGERLRSRQLEREVDRLKQNLEDYRRQLEWQKSSSTSTQRVGESDFRERLRKRDLEIAEQLDKMEELLNARDSLERQLHELTVQLGHVEEQRLLAIKDTEKMRAALAEGDRRADQLETVNQLLEGQVADLHERLRDQTGADEQIMTMVDSKAKEWESLLSMKQSEIAECRRRITNLEDQLKVVQRGTDKASIVKLKKQVQERDDQLAALQSELLEAVESIETLASQLDQTRLKADPLVVSQALHQEAEQLRTDVGHLREDLDVETRRRREAEEQKEEKDVELAQALRRLGEYERGEYGLHEAVQEIKMKKDEISVRDRDIAELTQHVNRLENQQNRLSEENEALRDQLGLGIEDSVDLSELRVKRNAETERLRTMNRMLENEVERLEEEKKTMRKNMLERAINAGQRAVERGLTSEDLAEVEAYADHLRQARRGGRGALGHPYPRRNLAGQNQNVQELTKQVADLQRSRDLEQQQSDLRQKEISRLSAQLRESKELVKQFEGAVRELTREREKGGKSGRGDRARQKPNSLDKLVSMLEAQNADGKYDVTLHLKAEVSQLAGQNSELREQLQRTEKDLREALRQLERKQFEVEAAQKEIQSLRTVASGFQPVPLPKGIPMTSGDVINSLNEHLVRALKELKTKERSLSEAREALERFQRKFAVIIHQQGVLYKEYHDARKTWETERVQRVEEKTQLVALREQDQIRVQELKQLQEMLSNDPDALKQRMGEMSRKVTILRVNEKGLSRRYTLLSESEATLRKEHQKQHRDMVAMEKAITERMGYLERHKEAALFKLSSLQQLLSECVPAAVLERANRDHNELVLRHQDSLQKQTSYTAASQTLEHLQAEVRTLSGQLEETRQELTLEKRKCHLLEERASVGGGAGESRSVVSGGGGDGKAVAEKMAVLETKELNERQRADLAVLRQRQAQESVSKLEHRNDELEEKFSELTHRILEAQSREAELADKLSACITPAEKELLEKQIQSLQKSEAQLRIENAQLKEVADVARQQSVAMETWQKSHDLELSSLRHQLLDLQTQSDEKTVIGKLHHQIVALQVSEATALKRQEETVGKVMKLEAALLRCEQQRDELGDRVFHVRAESQAKIKHLRGTLQVLRRQYAGAIPLSQQEKHADLMQRLQQDKTEAERLRERARAEHDQAQERLAQLELQHANLQELLAALKDSKNSAAKLTEWHAKLGEMRLQELKLNRTVERLKEQSKHLEELIAHGERRFVKLEQDLVQVTKDYESSQLSWEQRELELEQQLERLSQQHSEIAVAAAKAGEVSGNIPDPQLPVAEQLEQALRNLQLSTRSISDLKNQAERADEHANRLERALNRTQNELLRRDQEFSELRLQVRVLELDATRPREETDSGEAEAQRALRVARETIGELRGLVAQKENLSEKYQQLLQDSREELRRVTETHRVEVSSLTDQLHSQADSAFSKLKEAALEAVNVPRPELPTDKQLARLHELEDLIIEKEAANTRLVQQVSQVKQELREAQQASEASLARLAEEAEGARRAHQSEAADLRKSLKEATSRVTELEQEVEVLEGELSAAQEAAKKAPSRTMRSLVERLRNQLSLKEKQHKALTEALLQVRSDLVDTAQKTLEGQARQEIQDANVQQLVDRKTNELQTRLQDLSGHLDTLRQELHQSKLREAQTQDSVHQLERELTDRDRDASDKMTSLNQAEERLREQEKALEEAVRTKQELLRELAELCSHGDHTSEVEDLRKKVHNLQGKLDRQTQRTQEEHGTLQGSREREGAVASVESGSLVDSRHSSVEVVRWEEGKKWQKKLDSLRVRLSEKAKELDNAHRQIRSLKDMLTRAEREKGIVHGKLRAAQKCVLESSGSVRQDTKDGSPSLGEQHALKSRIFELEEQVQRLQREVHTQAQSSHHELEMKNTQLLGSVEALEKQLQQQSPGSAETLQILRDREKRLQEDLLQHQKENMQLRFECEQATLELPRLKARIEDQQQYIEVLRASADPAGNVRALGKKSVGDGGGSRSVAELERVVSAMRKVIEKLQQENDRLKKAVSRLKQQKTSQGGGGGGGGAGGELETENRRLRTELQRLQFDESSGNGVSSSSHKSPYTKIVAESDRLRRDLKREIERNERLQLSLSTLEVQNSKLRQELDEVSSAKPPSKPVGHSSHEERLELLRAELEVKSQMLSEVKKHLREAAERERHLQALSQDAQLSERYLAVLKERDMLQQQVAKLKKELDAFDPTFFEEIEDLKYTCQEAVRKNIQYEEQLALLSKQFGVTLPLTDS